MGKCISKDQQLKIREIDERSYIAITDEFEYYRYEDEDEFYDDSDDEGQSESKKSSSSKKMHGPETKGTSISFGFKKKNYSTSANSNKKQLNLANNNNVNREKEKQATIFSNLNVIREAEQNNFIITADNNNDDNGNFGTNSATAHSDDKEMVRTTSPAKLQPAKRDQHNVGRSNRFGFRQNVVRPTSGITPKFNEYDNVNNNNAADSVDIDKQRRVKSATAATAQLRSYSSNVGQAQQNLFSRPESKQNKSISEHQQQNEMNANTISNRPTSAAASQNQAVILSRYTLHSTSLPRPQYPVSVSVSAVPSYPTLSYNRNTATTTTSCTSSSSISNSNRPVHSVQNQLIDTKGAKHQANLNKRGGMMTHRDESLDSGIASHDSTFENHHHHLQQQQQQQSHQEEEDLMDTSFTRRSRRRFEMVPHGRHKFEIRDLNDYNENAIVVPLSLPKLPTDRNEIVTNGLIRSTNSYTTDNETDMSISEGSRPTSFISTASDADSFEEQKQQIDTSCSEKSLKGGIFKQQHQNVKSSSKTSSTVSSFSWRAGNCGESMATKNCSSMSSSDDCKNTHSYVDEMKKDNDCDEDELSSMTITADHSSYLNSSTVTKASPSKDHKETVNDAFLKQQQQPKMGTLSRKELFIHVDEVKFAETVAAANNSALLDDETSPSDSLVSSSESGGMPVKKVAESDSKESRQIDEIKEEEDLEDITPELISPGTPTHASNSFSLSDGGRDFFDDEIADQPALLISGNKNKHGSPSHHDDYKSLSMAMNLTSDCTSTTTHTLKDINSHGSLRSLNKLQALKVIKNDQSSPGVNRKSFLERSGSLDTLSPCDSIGSEDMMADFDINSSLDSIDRPAQSIDDLRMNSFEHDSKNSYGDMMMKESGAIFKSHQSVHRRHSSRENITSQLPARATRLLNRRLQNNSNNNNNPSPINGCDSPRSLDSMHSRNSSARASLREHLKQRQQLNLQSQLMNLHSSSEDLLADKSLKNSMLNDVVCFKKQLVQLRRILQEDEDKLMMSDTLNPFEVNGQVFSHLNGSNGIACENGNEKEMPSSDKEKIDDEKNVVLTNEQLLLLDDQRQELADLRRQVVFLQSQMDDKDRLIRQQQCKLEELQKDKFKLLNANPIEQDPKSDFIETANTATQTDRLRPMSQDFTSQAEPNKMPKDDSKSKNIPTITIKSSPPRNKTQISSVYTKLSSIKPTSSNNSSATTSKGSSIPTSPSSKPMKSTKIEHPKFLTTMRMQSSANVIRNNEGKSPLRRSIPQLVKSPTKNTPKQQKSSTATVSMKQKHHVDDSNGNSATSSLSTSSSNSSINAEKHNIVSNHNSSNSIGFLAQQLNEIYNRGLLE